MADVLVLYGQPDDPAAFDDYYANIHTPIALADCSAVMLAARPPGGEPALTCA